MMKKKRINWMKLQADLNKQGIPTPEQALCLKVAREMIERHPQTDLDSFFEKEPYEMNLEEFSRVFAEPALKQTHYKSVKEAEHLLEKFYVDSILTAVKENKESISVDGLSRIAFRTEYMKIVRRYCKQRGIDL